MSPFQTLSSAAGSPTADPAPADGTQNHQQPDCQQPVLLVLASASPARLQTLRKAGLHPHVVVSHVDEHAVAAGAPGPLSPADQVQLLARAKAEAVADLLRQGATKPADGDATGPHPPQLPQWEQPHRVVVVGCDSMLEVDGQALGKPHSAPVALRRVLALSQTSPILHTGHWVVTWQTPDQRTPTPQDPRPQPPVERAGQVCATTVHFGPISPAEAAAYVATGEPLEVAGSFTIDGLGGPFIRGVSGDPHNVVGISLPTLRELLAGLGVAWPTLWQSPPPPAA